MKDNLRRFRVVNLATLLAVFFLILVGSVVRVTESGMGCPDWPKCFGGYLPPSSVEELPSNYEDLFLEKRLAKTERLANTLSNVGLKGLADKVESDDNIGVSHQYDPLSAWIEYLNRLLGAVIGLFMLAYGFYAVRLRKTHKLITWWSVFGFILVLFQGWVGSLVVATNLIPGFISFHMGLALLLVMVLVYTYFKAENNSDVLPIDKSRLKWMSLSLLMLMIPQIFMGTNVRELIDSLFISGVEREGVMSSMNWVFYIHRSFSLVILLLSGYMLYYLYSNGLMKSKMGYVVLAVNGMVVIEAIGGAAMYYFAIPPSIQPLHLLTASVLFAAVYYLFLQTRLREVSL